MSKFLKFIVHLVVICTILCVVALAVPPFFGVQTVIMDDPQDQTNLPMGSVTYAIPVAAGEVPVGTRILVQEDGKTYRYNIISLDAANHTGVVADPTVSGAETLTVAVKNYVPKVVITIGYLGYLMMATKSIEGLVILGLAALFLIILYIIAELWRKEPADDEEEDEDEEEVYVKSARELTREEKERAKRMKEEDEALLKEEKARKKKEKSEKKIVRTGGFVDEVLEEDLEPEVPLPKKKRPVNEQTATSEAHELLKKEIAAATTEEPAPADDEIGFLADLEEEEEKPAPEQPKEKVVYKKMAIPTWTASQLAERARKDGDDPDIMKEAITKVTLFDYSDIISDDEE